MPVVVVRAPEDEPVLDPDQELPGIDACGRQRCGQLEDERPGGTEDVGVAVQRPVPEGVRPELRLVGAKVVVGDRRVALLELGVLAVDLVGHAVGRVRDHQPCRFSGHQAPNVGLGRAVPAHDPVIAQAPHVAPLDARVGLGGLPGGVEVERLLTVSLLAGVQPLEQLGDLVVVEAGQGEVDVRRGVEVGEQPGQQLPIPIAADPVERDVEEPGLLR